MLVVFSQPSWKICDRQNGFIIPRDENKKYLKPPPSFGTLKNSTSRNKEKKQHNFSKTLTENMARILVEFSSK